MGIRDHVKLETIPLRVHPDLDEVWVQDLIEKDPALLGLGNLVVRDRERLHPGAGRLDLLL